MLRGHLRRLAAVAVLAVPVIGFAVYRNQHRSPIVNIGNGIEIGVLVAQAQIPKGTPGNVIAETNLYKVTSLSRSRVEVGALVDSSTLKGVVAVKDIYPGQQLTAADFAPGAPRIISVPNQRAVVIKPTSPTGQITAGSHVDVWVAPNKHGSTSFSILHELFQDLYVLNVNNGAVTLRATPKQARKLTYLSAHTNDSIVLRLNRTVSG